MNPYATKKRRGWYVALIVLVLGIAIYGRFVEPAWIEVTRHEVVLGLASPLRIAHLSDLHTREIGRRETRLLALLEAEHPDVIVITGDVVNGDGSFEEAAMLIRKLHAPLGVWIVPGNWEGWIHPARHFEVLEQAGAMVLVNRTAMVRSDLWLVGIDDMLSGDPPRDDETTRLVSHAPKAANVIALLHEPMLLDRVAGKAPLALAGHTHGGQVRLPFLPPLWLPPGSGDYVEGWYTQSGTRMYVSRGIGNSLADVRFLCRPELAIITVR